MLHNAPHIALIAALVVCTAGLFGCDKNRRAEPLSDEEIEKLTDGQPEIFVDKNGSLTLEGIEDLYLGQSRREAMAVLEEYCDRIHTYDGGWRHAEAVFEGCIIDDGEHFKVIRAGFWPFNDDRVSTLEIKWRQIPLPVVRARFAQIADDLSEDLPRRGILMMATSRYRLLANWDDGADGPAHITIGFHPP